MAYAFDRIMNAMGRGEDETQQTNVFQPVNYSAMDGGEIGGGGAGGGSPSQGQQSLGSLQQAPTAGASRAIAANTGRVKSPVDLQGLSSQINDAKDRVQKEANAFVQKQTQPFALTDNQLPESEKEAMKNWAYQPNANPFFQPDSSFATKVLQMPTINDRFKIETPIDFSQQLNLIQNPAGLQQAFRMSGDPETTAGEAAFNASLLGRDTNFATQATGVKATAGELARTANELAIQTPQDAQNAAVDAWKLYSKAAKDAAAKEWNNLMTEGRETEARYESPEFLISQWKQDNPELAPFLPQNMSVQELQKAIGLDPDRYSAVDYITDASIGGVNSAGAFNRLSELLGIGDRARGLGESGFADIYASVDPGIRALAEKPKGPFTGKSAYTGDVGDIDMSAFLPQPKPAPAEPPTSYDVDLPPPTLGTTVVPVMPNPGTELAQTGGGEQTQRYPYKDAYDPLDYMLPGPTFPNIRNILR